MSSPDPHGGWIENLRFSVELLRDESHLEEVVARMRDLTMARAAYDLAVVQWPLKLIFLCQGGRIMRRSDRPNEQTLAARGGSVVLEIGLPQCSQPKSVANAFKRS